MVVDDELNRNKEEWEGLEESLKIARLSEAEGDEIRARCAIASALLHLVQILNNTNLVVGEYDD